MEPSFSSISQIRGQSLRTAVLERQKTVEFCLFRTAVRSPRMYADSSEGEIHYARKFSGVCMEQSCALTASHRLRWHRVDASMAHRQHLAGNRGGIASHASSYAACEVFRDFVVRTRLDIRMGRTAELNSGSADILKDPKGCVDFSATFWEIFAYLPDSQHASGNLKTGWLNRVVHPTHLAFVLAGLLRQELQVVSPSPNDRIRYFFKLFRKASPAEFFSLCIAFYQMSWSRSRRNSHKTIFRTPTITRLEGALQLRKIFRELRVF